MSESGSARVHRSAVVDRGAVLGAGSRVWHFSHIMKGAVIGQHCIVGQNCFVGEGVRIGSGVKLQNNVSVYSGVTLEDDVFCGPSVVFTNVLTPRAFIDRKAEFEPTWVKRGASIGANATIVCGVTLGAYCMVGAGTVVTSDVRDFELVLGVPARNAGWVSRRGERLEFDARDLATCRVSGELYRRTRSGVSPLGTKRESGS